MFALTSRERTLAKASAVVLAAILCYGAIYRPAQARIERLHELIPVKEAELEQILADSRAYLRLSQQPQSTGATTAALPRIETLIKEQGLAPLAKDLQPQMTQPMGDYTQSTVEITFDGIDMARLLAFLQRSQTLSPPLSVEGIHIKPDAHKSGLLAIIRLGSLVKP